MIFMNCSHRRCKTESARYGFNVQPADLHKQFKPRFDASWWHEVFAKHSRTSDNRFKKVNNAPFE